MCMKIYKGPQVSSSLHMNTRPKDPSDGRSKNKDKEINSTLMMCISVYIYIRIYIFVVLLISKASPQIGFGSRSRGDPTS